MTDRDDNIELVRGSGNVFADFGVEDAELASVSQHPCRRNYQDARQRTAFGA